MNFIFGGSTAAHTLCKNTFLLILANNALSVIFYSTHSLSWNLFDLLSDMLPLEKITINDLNNKSHTFWTKSGPFKLIPAAALCFCPFCCLKNHLNSSEKCCPFYIFHCH